jgi:hypothetical protein
MLLAENGFNKPINRMQARFHVGGRDVERSQFPFIHCWACTVHKVQGLTLPYVVVDLRTMWQACMGYVALSRTTSLQGLALLPSGEQLDKLRGKHKRKVADNWHANCAFSTNPEATAEYERLRKFSAGKLKLDEKQHQADADIEMTPMDLDLDNAKHNSKHLEIKADRKEDLELKRFDEVKAPAPNSDSKSDSKRASHSLESHASLEEKVHLDFKLSSSDDFLALDAKYDASDRFSSFALDSFAFPEELDLLPSAAPVEQKAERSALMDLSLNSFLNVNESKKDFEAQNRQIIQLGKRGTRSDDSSEQDSPPSPKRVRFESKENEVDLRQSNKRLRLGEKDNSYSAPINSDLDSSSSVVSSSNFDRFALGKRVRDAR